MALRRKDTFGAHRQVQTVPRGLSGAADWWVRLPNKGEQLNERVWKLFEKAGFETKPNTNNSAEHEVDLGQGKKRTPDLLAEINDLGVKLIGENTTAADPSKTFSTYTHDLSEIMAAASAAAGLLVFSAKIPTQEDRAYAGSRNITFWGERELAYYEAIADGIGTYARYEMCHALNVETSEEKQITNVLAIQFRQPGSSGAGSDIYMFTLPPEKLLKTCTIYRRAQGNPDAYQRMLRRNRLRSIKKFVTRPDALMPPGIIVHLGPQVIWEPIELPDRYKSGGILTLTHASNYSLGILQIPMGYGSLELIDGQHRLYGFATTEPATKQSFNLAVLGLKDLSNEKRRDTFVSINDNSRRMDPNLVAYLKHTDDEAECQKNPELMAIKIAVELNEAAPFKDRIRLLDVAGGVITLKGFSGYDLKSLLGPKGLMRKHYANDSTVYLKALRQYFSIVRSTFETPWKNPHQYIIATNRGVSAFLKLFKSMLRSAGGPLNQDIITKYLAALKNDWPDSAWDRTQLASAYIGSKGWSDFHIDLVKAIQNYCPEFKK